jgi:hypothetical protein
MEVTQTMIDDLAHKVALSGVLDMQEQVELQAKTVRTTTSGPRVVVKREGAEAKPKSKRGRKPSTGGRFWSDKFWTEYPNAEDIVRNDDLYPTCTSNGKYDKVKEFLRTTWKHKKHFKLPELVAALTELYPDESHHNGGQFRIHSWFKAQYHKTSGTLAIKPLWKKLSRTEHENLFYVPEED